MLNYSSSLKDSHSKRVHNLQPQLSRAMKRIAPACQAQVKIIFAAKRIRGATIHGRSPATCLQ
jgi:hypothetical protein